MALGLALRELQNIHPRTYVQVVLWYGVKTQTKNECFYWPAAPDNEQQAAHRVTS